MEMERETTLYYSKMPVLKKVHLYCTVLYYAGCSTGIHVYSKLHVDLLLCVSQCKCVSCIAARSFVLPIHSVVHVSVPRQLKDRV